VAAVQSLVRVAQVVLVVVVLARRQVVLVRLAQRIRAAVAAVDGVALVVLAVQVSGS